MVSLQFVEAYKEFGKGIRGFLKNILEKFTDITEFKEEKGVIVDIKAKNFEFSTFHENLGFYLVVYDESVAKIFEETKLIITAAGELLAIDSWDYVSYEIDLGEGEVDPDVLDEIINEEILLEEEFDDYLEMTYENLNIKLYKNKIRVEISMSNLSGARGKINEILKELEKRIRGV